MTLYYSSNEKKQKAYIKDRKLQEFNDELQQQVVDDEIASVLGIERKSNNLGKLAVRLINKLGEDLLPKGYTTGNKKLTPMELLTASIQTGSLSQLFQRLKSLPDSQLNPTQRAIRDDLNNPLTLSVLNDSIVNTLPAGAQATASELINLLGGPENVNNSLDMVEKSSESESESKSEPTLQILNKRARGRPPGAKNKKKWKQGEV